MGFVDNTADINKPISTATLEALGLKASKVELNEAIQPLNNHLNNKDNPHHITKVQIGLGAVDNTSDVNKAISIATQAALDLKASKLEIEQRKATPAQSIAGVDDALFVTPVGLSTAIKALTLNSALIPRDVTASRFINTTYTNPSTSMKIVCIGFKLPVGSNVNIAVNDFIQGFATNLGNTAIDEYLTLYGFVPPSGTYRFNVIGGNPSIQLCTEISL